MPWILGAALATAVLVLLVRAYAPRAVHAGREPTDERLAALLERAGLAGPAGATDRDAGPASDRDAEPTIDREERPTARSDRRPTVQRVRVVETTSERAVDATLRGLPGRRELWVTAPVLDLDADVGAALLAVEAGRVRYRHGVFQALAAGALVGTLAAALTGRVDFDLGLLALGAGGLVAFAVGRRIEYAADAWAARRVGAATVADAYEHVAAVRGDELAGSDWQTYFEVEPPVGERVRRLRERE